MKRWLCCLAASLAALALDSSPAQACGGLFCSTMPVDQSGEKILFAVDDHGIEVHVQISYQGDDADFAWVVPTRQPPTLAVGSQQVFTTLAQDTMPIFSVRWHFSGSCRAGGGGGGAGGAGGSGGAVDGSAGGGGGVVVVSQDQVGPYDSAVVRSDDPQALRGWLQQNGYNLTPAGSALIDPYVREQSYFVALKLHAGHNVGEIQPIVLRFAGSEPCVPLRLTAVAALNDMDVTAFVLGQHRAVPSNYYEVKVDLARIDWIGFGQNYQQVVSAAANEATGNAFVTEYAGTSNILKGQLYQPGRYNLDLLRSTSDPALYVSSMIRQGFQSSATLLSILRRWIPEPAALAAQGIPDTVFYNCLECYAQYLRGFVFDPVGMTADLDARIVQPLAEAQALFDRLPYLTRLHTLISPPEMTTDPTFTFNADLGSVSNQHLANGYVSGCYGDGPVTLVLPDGRIILIDPREPRGSGGSGLDLDALPAAQDWFQMGPSGPGLEVGSNGLRIDQLIGEHNQRVRDRYAPPFWQSGGCGAAPGALGGSLAGLGLLAAIALALRRRRRC
ncbi:MAG TPA: DUF2330 domain-containing protein [Polyangia bacterium]|nr:DUF2330 domain-containing protein [Polyangia bacterium]